MIVVGECLCKCHNVRLKEEDCLGENHLVIGLLCHIVDINSCCEVNYCLVQALCCVQITLKVDFAYRVSSDLF